MIEEEVRDVSNVGVEAKTEGRDSVPGPRGEPEAPRAELPEWLAKELFRIFV